MGTAKNSLLTLPQYCLPQHWLSRTLGKVANNRDPMVAQWLIKRFIQHYQVDVSEALRADLSSYHSFNDFFTRALKPDARPLPKDPKAIVSPADGTVSQAGIITDGRIFQAKGHSFSAQELLACSAAEAAPFHNGRFITVYLSPKDYHRVHLPYAGTLTAMTYIPGKLFSVNPRTASTVPRLFARNERVACWFDTTLGPMVVVLVGAFFVASIETVWAGVVAPNRKNPSQVQHIQYAPKAYRFKRGDEIGRFQFGSTAIVLLPESAPLWREAIKAESVVKMGQTIA